MQSRSMHLGAGIKVSENKGTATTEQFLHLLGLQWQARVALSAQDSVPPAWVDGPCTLSLPWHRSPP